MASEYNVLTGRFTERPEPGRREPEDFEELLCDAPGFFDPLHRDEVSARCALVKGHPGKHRGYLPAEWP